MYVQLVLNTAVYITHFMMYKNDYGKCFTLFILINRVVIDVVFQCRFLDYDVNSTNLVLSRNGHNIPQLCNDDERPFHSPSEGLCQRDF